MPSTLLARRPSGRIARLRALSWPILQSAATAVVAWYAAKLALGDRETGFAPIAALICLSAATGQQRAQAVELTTGVVIGVLIADLLVRAIGTGPPQVGLMVVLAMSATGLMGGAVALLSHGLVFPSKPVLHVGRAAQTIFAGLGGTLEALAAALETGD